MYGIGTNADPVASLLTDYLKQFSYTTHEFRISQHLRTLDVGIEYRTSSTFDEMNALMNAGNEARRRSRSDNILAVIKNKIRIDNIATIVERKFLYDAARRIYM